MKRMTMRLEYRNLSTNKEKESERGKDQLRRLKGRQSETTTAREGASKREREMRHMWCLWVCLSVNSPQLE